MKLASDTYNYVLNFDKFHVYFRNQSIIALAKEKFNSSPSTETVLTAFIDKVQPQLLSCKFDSRTCNSFNLDDLPKVPVNKHDLAVLITDPLVVHGDFTDPLSNYLETLTKCSPKFFYKDDETNGGAYSLNLKVLGEAMKLECIQETILGMFGADAVRIWRVLLLNGKLDDTQVNIKIFILFIIRLLLFQ